MTPKQPTDEEMGIVSKQIVLETYGLDLKTLRSWAGAKQKEMLKQEEYLQEMAVAKVHGFVHAIYMIVRLQTWWRMMKIRCMFRVHRRERIVTKRKFYLAWKRFWKSEKMHKFQTLGIDSELFP